MMPETSLLPAIERALRNLRYGYVQLVVHDGQLVRIERVERIRLTGPSGSPDEQPGRPTPPMEGGPDDPTTRLPAEGGF